MNDKEQKEWLNQIFKLMPDDVLVIPTELTTVVRYEQLFKKYGKLSKAQRGILFNIFKNAIKRKGGR